MSTGSDFELATGPDWTAIKLESRRLDRCLDHYRTQALDAVAISPITGFEGSDLEFFRDHPYVRGVDLSLAGGIDLGGLRHLVDLEYLRVDGNLVTLDLARFRRLRDVDLVWHSKLGLTPDCTALRRVLLRKYKSRSRSLDELPVLPELHDLALVQGHLESLEGVAKFRALRRLELSYLRRLTSLGPLAAVRDGALEQLECYRCPRLEDHAVVSQLPSLRVLRFIGCGRIASLGFVNAMPALEELRFVDSNVVDGDMSPCLRLKRVGFNNKRHYSHTLLKVLTHIGGPELESYVRTMRDLTSIRAAGREARELG